MKTSILHILLIIMLVSCSTMDKFYMESELKKAMLTGKVINEEGLPLEGVTIKMTNFRETKTDINGRFLYNFIPFGKYKITCEKEGYTKSDFLFTYNLKNKKLPYVKIKMFSLNYLITEGFELLKERKTEKVQNILEKIKTIDSNQDIVLYFEAIFNYEINNLNTSMTLLEKLREMDRKNIYYQITLARIYEKLELYDKAIDLYLYIARNDKKKYNNFIEKSALLYLEKLNDNDHYTKLMDEFNAYIDKER